MRAKIVATFVLGFAVGCVCLGAVLWREGAIRPTAWMRAFLPGWQRPMVPLPLNLNELSAEAKNMSHPAVEPPPPLAGEADRAAPDHGGPPRLAMPIAGLDARSLADTPQETLDIPAPQGTRVLAVGNGNVAKLFTSKDDGLSVYQFDPTKSYCYYYSHLDRYAPGLVEGTLLRQGEVLGYVGSTDLHFAVFELKPDKKWWTGTAIDPLPLLR